VMQRLTWPYSSGGLSISALILSCLTGYIPSGQIVPIHPLDVTPKSLTNSSECVGSFVPQSVGVGEGAL